jgi:hypothetical protein
VHVENGRFQFAVRAVSGGSPRRRSIRNERIRVLCPLAARFLEIEARERKSDYTRRQQLRERLQRALQRMFVAG